MPDFGDSVEVPENFINISRREIRRLERKYGALRCRLPIAVKEFKKCRREVVHLVRDE